MTTKNGTKPEVLFTEAPASWTTKYLSPDGFVCRRVSNDAYIPSPLDTSVNR